MALASSMNIIMNLTVFPIKYKRWPDVDYAYPFILWAWMYFLNGDPFETLKLWFFMYIFYSFFFFKVLLCEHRMPELWTEGNARIWDFGEHTVASTSDVNPSVTGIFSYMFLAGFNLHAIHHFFPTADHSILPRLNEILIQVCK
jgi:fatty acid desaturase